MIEAATFWAFVGTLQLLIASYKDFVNNMKVDDRYNFFMIGASVSLLPNYPRGILYMLAAIIMIPIIYFIIKKTKVLGEGDATAISWLVLGYYILGVGNLLIFAGVFVIILLFYLLLRIGVIGPLAKKANPKTNTKKPLPFYPVLFIIFVTTNILARLYI